MNASETHRDDRKCWRSEANSLPRSWKKSTVAAISDAVSWRAASGAFVVIRDPTELTKAIDASLSLTKLPEDWADAGAVRIGYETWKKSTNLLRRTPSKLD